MSWIEQLKQSNESDIKLEGLTWELLQETFDNLYKERSWKVTDMERDLIAKSKTLFEKINIVDAMNKRDAKLEVRKSSLSEKQVQSLLRLDPRVALDVLSFYDEIDKEQQEKDIQYSGFKQELSALKLEVWAKTV